MSDLPKTLILYCMTHKSSSTGQTERCLVAVNAALRLGINPFDNYNNRKIQRCVIVNATIALTPPTSE